MYIFIILIAGLVLRLISLNQSLWLDEATTALVSRMSLTEMFTKFLPSDFHPPFYYLIMKYWTVIFGYSEISLRIPSIIFGLGTVYIAYLIGKKLFDKKTALIAAALVSTSGLFVYYSQEARMYALAAFLVSLSVYLFLQKKWLFFSIILALIGMTDYVALFIIPVYFIVGWKYWKKIILSLIPLVVSFIFWSPIFIEQILAGVSVKGSDWWNLLGLPTLKNLALIPIKFMFGRISFENKTLYFIVAVVASCIFGFLLYKSIKAAKILWVWLIFPIFLGAVTSFLVPSLTYFRYLFCLTPFYLLVAYGVGKLGKLSKITVAVLIAFNLLTTGWYLFNPKFQRENWRGLVGFINSAEATNSITIFPTDANTEAYRYYAANAKIAGQEGITGGYKEIWLVGYLSSVFDPKGAAKSKIEALGYRQKAEYSFNGIGNVYLYEK